MHVFSILISGLMLFSFIITCRSNPEAIEQYEGEKKMK